MQKAHLFPKPQSTQLRHHLESRLAAIFTQGEISRYLSVNGCESHALLGSIVQFPHLRLAYSIWLGMQTADRHAVLAKFQLLCAETSTGAAGNKTVAFCAVFINEFAGILAETMEWPD
jgi:hypothetical protein